MKFITGVICMMKLHVYGKGFLIKTESGHRGALRHLRI